MSGIRGFEKALNVFAKGIGIGVETVIKKVSLQVFTGVVKKTPVDKGRARASWVIGVERPTSSPPISKNKTFSPSEATAQASLELTKLSKVKPWSTVFVSNSVPYIERLEDGYSEQARDPDGMVAVTLAEVERDIKRIGKEFK